jgi:hypothetical protein
MCLRRRLIQLKPVVAGRAATLDPAISGIIAR